MRVTENLMVNTLLQDLRKAQGRLQRYQEQVATGRSFARPSDAPSAMARDLRLRSALNESDQYLRNTDDALNWLETTESALNSATQVLQRARALATAAGNAAPQSSLESMAMELAELKDHLVHIANTTLDGRYIFSGHQTLTAPFTVSGALVQYQGDNGLIVREIGSGATLDINTPGDQIFAGAFAALENLRSDLKNGKIDQISSARLAEMDKALDAMIGFRAQIGAKTNRMELTRSRLLDTQISLTRVLSEIEDADLSQVIMELASAEQAYQVALAAGARVIQPTLIDFLR